MFPISVNEQRACEVAWFNSFTTYTHTERSASSHTGLQTCPFQRWSDQNEPRLRTLTSFEREIYKATHITYTFVSSML